MKPKNTADTKSLFVSSFPSASSLSGVQPPEVWYRIDQSMPEEIIQEGRLSALQLEAVAYAAQQHWTMLQDQTRAGFLIGDGAGVGKGRTIAGEFIGLSVRLLFSVALSLSLCLSVCLSVSLSLSLSLSLTS